MSLSDLSPPTCSSPLNASSPTDIPSSGIVGNGYRSKDVPLSDLSPPSSLKMLTDASSPSPCAGVMAVSPAPCSGPNSAKASPTNEEKVSLNHESSTKSSPDPTEWTVKESKEECSLEMKKCCVACGRILCAKKIRPCVIGKVQPKPCPSCTTTLSSIGYHPEDSSSI